MDDFNLHKLLERKKIVVIFKKISNFIFIVHIKPTYALILMIL
jgi:hypothetical protein